MGKKDGLVRKEVDDDKTPKQSPAQSNQTPQQSPAQSNQTPQQSPAQSNQTPLQNQNSPLPPFQDYPQLTGLIQSKRELRNSHLKAPKSNLCITTTTPNQNPQINNTWQMDQRLPNLLLQRSYLSVARTTHGSSSPSVNVTPTPDLSSLSQEPNSASSGLQTRRTIHKNSASVSQGSSLPRCGNRLRIFELLAAGIEIPDLSSSASTPTPKASAQPFTLNPPRQASQQLPCDHHNPQFLLEIPDMSSSSGKGKMSASTPTPKASAKPFTFSPPRQASQQLPCDLWDSSNYDLKYPILSSEIQSKKELKNAHLKTPTASLSNTTTTTTHGPSPSVDLPETVPQEPDLSSASEDKLKDDEITGQNKDPSAFDDKVQ